MTHDTWIWLEGFTAGIFMTMSVILVISDIISKRKAKKSKE